MLKNTNNWRVQLPERKKICLVVKEYKEQINAVFSKECSLKETQSVPEERKVRDKWKNSRVRLVVEQCMRRELWSPLHNKAWNAFRKLVSKICHHFKCITVSFNSLLQCKNHNIILYAFLFHPVYFTKHHLLFLFPRLHYLHQLPKIPNHTYCLT